MKVSVIFSFIRDITTLIFFNYFYHWGYFVRTGPGFNFPIPPLVTKGRDLAKIHVPGIIRCSNSVSGQDSFFLCQGPIGKVITAVIWIANPTASLLLGYGENFICTIVVNRITQCEVHKTSGVRGDAKGNLMSRAVYIGRLGYADRYIRPDQKFIQPHIARITGLVKNSFFAIIIDFYSLFSGGLFLDYFNQKYWSRCCTCAWSV